MHVNALFSVDCRVSFQIKAADFSPLTSSILTGNTRFVTMALSFNGDLKGRSQLWGHADLDTSFLTLKNVHPNLKSKFI